MRTTVEIDDELMRQAMRASGAPTKRAAVELGLRMLVSVRGQQAIRRLRRNVKWTGDLDAGRLGRVSSGR
jgi:Arc/MetJ family transcription regulator